MYKSAPKSFSFSDFSLGWDNVTSPLQTDPRAVKACKNFNLTTQKGLEKRGGMVELYPTVVAAAAVKSLYEYKAPNSTNYVLVAADTKIRSYYGATWNDWKINLAAGQKFSFLTHWGFCYAVNGVDANIKFWMDGGGLHAWGVGIAPPAAAPVVAEGDVGTLTGKFKYVYVYRRDSHKLFNGNPSPASAEQEVTLHKVKVSVVASTDPQVDHIWLYRTYNLFGEGADSTQFWYVGEFTNATQDIQDDTSDANLGALCEDDNTVPPKAKFLTLHKDRIYFANCPAEDDGESLIRWSKVGIGDAAPSTHYHYFDRMDGEPITGVASLGDLVVVFKRNKFGVLTIDTATGAFESWRVVDAGVGCIAPWAILPLEDKLIFLSEEGWRAFDGESTYDLSEKISGLINGGYISINEAANYSVVHYPLKHQFRFLMNTTVTPKLVMVGHFLVPLLYVDKGIPEEKSENIVSWTYHQYDYHTLTVLGTYTDANGITRVIAGSSDGYIYQLDSGSDDDGQNIAFELEQAWSSLGVPESYTKTVRYAYIGYMTDLESNITVKLDVDFTPDVSGGTLYGSNATFCGYCYCGYCYCGMSGTLNEMMRLNGTGNLFRYRIYGTGKETFALYMITTHFRLEGSRG